MNTAETQLPPSPPPPPPAAPNYANLVDRFGAVLIDSLIAAIPAIAKDIVAKTLIGGPAYDGVLMSVSIAVGGGLIVTETYPRYGR